MELPDSVPTIFDIDGLNTSFDGEISSYGAFSSSLKNDLSEADIEPPFIEVHRSGLTHAPYPNDEGSLDSYEYFKSRSGDNERLCEEYATGAERSVEFLERRVDELEERGILEETLVIYTSDHGELLGERGVFDHTTPMVPELVYIPTVFINDHLDGDAFVPDPDDDVIEHVDITATMLGVLGMGDALETAGTNLLATERPRDQGFSTTHLQRNGRTAYQADGLWDYEGGYSLSRSNRLQHCLLFAYQLLRGTQKHQLRRTFPTAIRNYLQKRTRYGEPDFTLEDAEVIVEDIRDRIEHVAGSDADLSEDVERRLQELGYRP